MNEPLQLEVRHLVAPMDYPWAVQVVCTLCHRTTQKVVGKYIKQFFNVCCSPADMRNIPACVLEGIISKGGFVDERISTLRFQAMHFAQGNPAETCPFLCRHALESHRLFVLGDRDFEPESRPLRIWLEEQKSKKSA